MIHPRRKGGGDAAEGTGQPADGPRVYLRAVYQAREQTQGRPFQIPMRWWREHSHPMAIGSTGERGRGFPDRRAWDRISTANLPALAHGQMFAWPPAGVKIIHAADRIVRSRCPGLSSNQGTAPRGLAAVCAMRQRAGEAEGVPGPAATNMAAVHAKGQTDRQNTPGVATGLTWADGGRSRVSVAWMIVAGDGRARK